MKAVRVFVIGDVIGVGFRAWTAYHAKKLGVKGWVKNTYDKPEIFGHEGGVEALLQGENRQLEKMIKLLKQGPPLSQVKNIVIANEKTIEIFNDFQIR